ncbi:hypothetical protein CCP2SC5_880007 [Azospirillaceae bacterium]
MNRQTLTEHDRQYLKALCRASLYHLCVICGGFSHQGGNISPVIHREICRYAQDSTIKRKAFALGRSTRKTTVLHRWRAIHIWLNDPEARVMLGSQSMDVVRQSMTWIKGQLMGNEMLRWLFWEELGPIDEKWRFYHRFSNSEIELPRHGMWAEPTFFAISTGGAAQGKHFSHILLSDIIGQRELESTLEMESSILWFQNVQELLDNPESGEISMDLTFWNLGDAYINILDNYPEYRWWVTPALKAGDDLLDGLRKQYPNLTFVQHPEAEIGETNLPDIYDEKPPHKQVFPTEYYDRLKNNPSTARVFWTQHMNLPWHGESRENSFKVEWLRYYTLKSVENDTYIVCDDKEEVNVRDISWYGAIDPGGFASRGLKRSSRCAAVIAGQAPNSLKKFIAWVWAGRPESPTKLSDIILDANEKWRVRHWYLESIGSQEFIRKHLLEAADVKKKRIYILQTPKGESDLAEDAKLKRIGVLIEPCYLGQWHILRSMTPLISEYMAHPSGLTNDILDAWSWLQQLRFPVGNLANTMNEQNKKRYDNYLNRLIRRN